MGLDMYALTTREDLQSPVDFDTDLLQTERLHYWYRRSNLNAWMAALYAKRGGLEVFNNVPVVLTAQDLNRLEADVKAGNLPRVGKVLGEQYVDGTEDDLTFIANARVALSAGLTVFYRASW